MSHAYVYDLNTDLANLAVRFDAEARTARAEAARLAAELEQRLARLESSRAAELALPPAGDTAAWRAGIEARYGLLMGEERYAYGRRIEQQRQRAARQTRRAQLAREGLLLVDSSDPMDQAALARDYPGLIQEAYAQSRVQFYGPGADPSAVA